MERPPEINPRNVDDVTENVTVWRQSQMEKGDGHRFSLLDKKPVHAILLIFKQVKHQYNLQYFSYHYHHYNEHYISKFWQVRNLQLPFHLLLAKIIILASMLVGRVCYLSVCLSVCYLPKFTFWQVCSLVVFVCLSVCLLLAKIYILASMFVVCLFVCTEISQNLKNESANHHQTW